MIYDERKQKMDANELVRMYVKIRDAKDEVKRKAQEKIAAIEEDLAIVEAELSKHLQTTGATSIKTASGTVYQTVKSKIWTDNWEAFYAFVADKGLFDLLERRIHQSNMKALLEESPDDVPEGLNVESTKAITVRRK